MFYKKKFGTFISYCKVILLYYVWFSFIILCENIWLHVGRASEWEKKCFFFFPFHSSEKLFFWTLLSIFHWFFSTTLAETRFWNLKKKLLERKLGPAIEIFWNLTFESQAVTCIPSSVPDPRTAVWCEFFRSSEPISNGTSTISAVRPVSWSRRYNIVLFHRWPAWNPLITYSFGVFLRSVIELFLFYFFIIIYTNQFHFWLALTSFTIFSLL